MHHASSATSRTRRRRLGSMLAAAALAAGATVALLPAPHADATTTTIDCSALTTDESFVWIPFDETASITVSNCTAYSYAIRDGNGDTVDEGASADGAYIIEAGGRFRLYDSFDSTYFTFRAKRVYPEHVPSGSRQIVADLELPADAPDMPIGDVAPGEYNQHYLNDLSECRLVANSRHVYSSVDIVVNLAGTYTFRGVATNPVSDYLSLAGADNPIGDPYLALYEEFDPDSPDDNVVGCNDDLNDLFGYDNDGRMAEELEDGTLMEGHLPYFVTDLQPGTYTLVLTLWAGIGSAEWAEQYGPADVTFEMWGPDDSMCLVGDEGCEPPSSGFDCESTPYFQVTDGRLVGKTSITGAGSLIGRAGRNYNALAHNPGDGTLYAMRNGKLINITPDGITELGSVEGLPNVTHLAADIDPETGTYYVGRPSTGLYAVDLETLAATRVTLPRAFGQIGRDLVLRNGWAWTLEPSGRLKGVNLTTKALKNYNTGVTGGAGAMWQTGESQITVWRNNTGDYVRFSGVGGASVTKRTLGTVAPAASTDGATCRATVA